MTKDLLEDQIKALVTLEICGEDVANKFLQRSHEGKLTRDENPESHVCVYFAAVSPQSREVFLGHHKKSGKWLFNGGHIDKAENLEKALEREIGEEWGVEIKANDIGKPSLLTITPIYNPPKQPCREHYDVWYFVSVTRENFHPDKEKLKKEFYETRWLSLGEAGKLTKDPNTIHSLKVIEDRFGFQ